MPRTWRDTAAGFPVAARHDDVLPQQLADLYEAMNHALSALFAAGDHQLTEHNAERLVPKGPGSEQLRAQVSRSPLPRALHESTDGRWAIAAPQTKSVQLEENGMVVNAGEGLRLKAGWNRSGDPVW